VLFVDTSKCIGCANCTAVCSTGAIVIDSDSQKATIDADVCIECYSCMNVCPQGSILEKD